MRQSEFKRKYEQGRYTRQHIYGEEIADVFSSIVKAIFGKTTKETAKTGAKKH